MPTLRCTFCAVVILLQAITTDAAYCPNGQLEEAEIRDKVLSEINNERQLVLSGGRQNGRSGANLPPAASMPNLTWSCTLEEDAINMLGKTEVNGTCDFNLASPPTDKAYFSFVAYDYFEFNDLIYSRMIRIDSNELSSISDREVKYSGESELKAYAILISAGTTEIACAKSLCSVEYLAHFACIVNRPFLENGDIIYELAVSTTTGHTTLATTSSGATYCLNGQSTIAEINDKILPAINAERQLVRSGGRPNGQSGTNLPAAANLPNVTWCCYLEQEVMRIHENRSCEAFSTDKAFFTTEDFYYDTGEISDAIRGHMRLIDLYQLTGVGGTTLQYKNERGLEFYASFIRATTTEIGCAKCFSEVWNMGLISCIVNTPFIEYDEVIYEIAKTSSPTTTESTTSNPLYCWDGRLSEADVKNKVLAVVNSERQLVLSGGRQNGPNGTNLPAPTTMPDLEWSCSLEQDALEIVYLDDAYEYCSMDHFNPEGKTFLHFSDEYYDTELDVFLKATLQSIESFALDISAKEVTMSDPGIQHYADLIRATTTEIACAKKNSSRCSRYTIVCLTNKPSLQSGEVVYEFTPTTIPVTTEPPASVISMTEELRNAFLVEHNKLRSALALGNVTNGNNVNGTLLRRANQMPTLVYCLELEKTAVDSAIQCENMDSSVQSTTENSIKYANYSDGSLEILATAAVQVWWSELQSTTGIDQIQNLFFSHAGISSFAKIASDLTTGVGCGIVRCQNTLYMVCHYQTTLVHGAKLYNYGPSCKKCPDGVSSCVDGLCPATDGQCLNATTQAA